MAEHEQFGEPVGTEEAISAVIDQLLEQDDEPEAPLSGRVPVTQGTQPEKPATREPPTPPSRTPPRRPPPPPAAPSPAAPPPPESRPPRATGKSAGLLQRLRPDTRTMVNAIAKAARNRQPVRIRYRNKVTTGVAVYRTVYPYCLTGDTKISLVNGTEVPIKDLVGRDPLWVYSYDHESGKIVPGLAIARKTRENAELVEVELDNCEKVHCTPDHLWMLRDGSYRAAQDLKSGDSLMPLYRKLDNYGYERREVVTKISRTRHSAFLRTPVVNGRINHKVIVVRKLAEREDCYDLSVEKYHNFALSAGIFVHNSLRVRNIHVRGYDNPPEPTIVFFGYDPFKDTIKMFVADRIITVERIGREFQPKWPVEFSDIVNKVVSNLIEKEHALED